MNSTVVLVLDGEIARIKDARRVLSIHVVGFFVSVP